MRGEAPGGGAALPPEAGGGAGPLAWFGSLKARMSLVLGLVLLLPAAYAVSQALGTYAAQAGREVADLRRTAAQVSAHQAGLLAQARAALERLASRPELAPGADPAACSALLAAEAARGGDGGGVGFLDLVATDAAGRAACASAPHLLGLGLGDRAWFAEARARGGGGPAVVAADLRAGVDPAPGGSAALPLAAPLPPLEDRGGAFAGVLAADLDPARLAAAPAGLELPEGAVAHLLDRAAQLAAPPDPARETLPGWAEIAALLADPGGAAAVVDGPSGRTRFAAAEVEPGRLYALVGLPAPRWSWLERDLLQGVIAPVLMLALAVAGIWIATDYLVNRHVEALAAAARDYARGRHAGWPRLGGAPAELRQLASVLARVTAELGAREAELEASLAHKEALLREVHHRVKNNLQVVTSLLNLRAQAASSPAARAAMLEAQSRVKALALAHRGLYEGDGGGEVGSVELRPFVAELCDLLEDTVPGRAAGGAVEVRLELEPVRVGIDRAVPVALFVTEALSNAFKHAFPEGGGRDGGGGTVSVSLARAGDGGAAARLTVSDDGVGLDPDPTPGAGPGPGPGGVRARGLGMTLMRLLAGQTGGRLKVGAREGGGTVVELEFPLAAAPPAPAPAAAAS